MIEAQLISREQALSELQEQSGLGEALKELPENPLPPVISVTPKQIDRAGLRHCASSSRSCLMCSRRSSTWYGSSA